MAREKRWPSKWWFWSVPILAHLYLALCFAVFWALRRGVFARFFTGGLRSFLDRAARASLVPALLFNGRVLGPLVELLNVDVGSLKIAVAIGMGVGELCAVVGGLLLYGGAALVSVMVQGERGGERGRTDGA